MNIFIGWDTREDQAYRACANSIRANTDKQVYIAPLKKSSLELNDLFYRHEKFPDEQASTEFAFTRFLVPRLCNYKGWALFVDCDFIFTTDVTRLLDLVDNKYAVMCVKHEEYTPALSIKMDGCKQTTYPKKNWSSCMLFNCEHPDTRKLTIQTVNEAEASWLHQMKWAEEHHIGELPKDWNWLVGEENYKKELIKGLPSAIHYTNGCPFMEGHENCDFADEYWKYVND